MSGCISRDVGAVGIVSVRLAIALRPAIFIFEPSSVDECRKSFTWHGRHRQYVFAWHAHLYQILCSSWVLTMEASSPWKRPRHGAPRVLCCTPCALLAWKLSQPWQPPPAFEAGPIVGYVTECDVAYRRNIIVRVVQRRAFSEPPCHLPRILESPVQGCISPRRRYDPTVGRMSRQWSKR